MSSLMSRLLALAALIAWPNAVSPSRSWAKTSAPCAMSALTSFKFPRCAPNAPAPRVARINGVSPKLSGIFTAPARVETNFCFHSPSRIQIAESSAVRPERSWCAIETPREINHSHISIWQFSAAVNSSDLLPSNTSEGATPCASHSPLSCVTSPPRASRNMRRSGVIGLGSQGKSNSIMLFFLLPIRRRIHAQNSSVRRRSTAFRTIEGAMKSIASCVCSPLLTAVHQRSCSFAFTAWRYSSFSASMRISHYTYPELMQRGACTW